MPRQSIATKDYTTPLTVVFHFSDGEDVTITSSDFPHDTQERLTQYGMGQKFGDEYAGAEGPAEGRAALLSLFERLKNGEWKAPRASGGGATRSTMLAEALARVTKQEIEVCQAKIAEMEDDAVKALRQHPTVAVALAEIKAERTAAAAVKAKEDAAKNAEEAPSLNF